MDDNDIKNTMAVNFNSDYTGRDSNVKIPELDSMERSIARNSQNAMRGEEMKLEQSLRTKERMLKNMEVDPVSIANDILMNRQALDLERYNVEMGTLLLKNEGRPGGADEYKATVLKNNLAVKQEKLLTQSKIAEGVLNTLKGDTRNYYDKDYGMDRYRKWLVDPDKNPLDASALKVKPQDVARLLEKNTFEGDGKNVFEDIVDEKGNIVPGYKQEYHISRSKEQAQEIMLQDLFSDQSYVQGVLDRFGKQDESKIASYFTNWDGNGDGKVDPADKQYAFDNVNVKDNPIINWYLNDPYYLDRGMRKQRVGTSKDTTPSAKVDSGSNSATIMDGTRKVSYYIPKAAPVYLGANYHSDKYYTLPTTAARSISLNTSDTNAVKVLTEGMEDTVKRPPVISAIPTGYDAQNDTFTFDVRKDFANIGINGIESGSGMQIAVSRKALNNTDLLDSFVVLDESGKKVKIGDLAKTVKPTDEQAKAPKPTWIEFKKTNSNGTVEDYNQL